MVFFFCYKTIQRGIVRQDRSDAFDLFEHLEYALGRLDEKTLEGFAKATTLKRVATRTFDFCHNDLQKPDKFEPSSNKKSTQSEKPANPAFYRNPSAAQNPRLRLETSSSLS